MFVKGKIEKDQLVVFWSKFFDPTMTLCPKQEYMQLLEQLVRGKCLDKPNEATRLFARDYSRKLREEGCLTQKDEIDVKKLRAAFDSNRIDPNKLTAVIKINEA